MFIEVFKGFVFLFLLGLNSYSYTDFYERIREGEPLVNFEHKNVFGIIGTIIYLVLSIPAFFMLLYSFVCEFVVKRVIDFFCEE